MARVEAFLSTQAAKRPDARAAEDPFVGAVTYRALAEMAEAWKEALAPHVAPGDRVVLVLENCVSAVAALFAVWSMGATAVPVNARQTPRELDRVIDHADPVCVVFFKEASPDAAAHCARLQGEGASLSDILPKTPSLRDGDPNIAVILYTTGTTGVPKGVMLTHENVCFGGLTSAALRDMVAWDVILGVLPITHVFGLSSVLVASISTGAFIRLLPRFSAEAALEALARDITLFSGVPQMHALIMAVAEAQGLAQLGSPSLRYVSSGAAPLDPAWKRGAEAFYGVAVQNGYGMTESTAGIAATRHSIGNPDISVGPALPGVSLTIDQTVAGGGDGMGEVLTRGPHVMPGYFRAPAATAAVLGSEGWLRTGDLGKFAVDGTLHILGRSKELIIRGGFNVYPPEVEAVLTDHPGVIQSAVIGRMVNGDEEVLAFVQVPEGSELSVATLRDFVTDRLVGYKRPQHYVLAADLPAAPTGKVLKHKLLDWFEDQLP